MRSRAGTPAFSSISSSSSSATGESNHTVADQATHTLAQHTGRNQVQHSLLAIDHQGVARIVTALKTNYGGCLVGQ